MALTATLTYALFELGSTGKTVLPFVMILFAVVIYLFSKTIVPKVTRPFYHKGILLANSFSLILFYFSRNYLAVRYLLVLLFATEITPNNDTPFAFFFYGFTFIVPLFYLVYSLFKKDRKMLWIGVLILCFSTYTILFFYPILSIEIALTIGVILLFAFTYFAIRRRKNKETGVTF